MPITKVIGIMPMGNSNTGLGTGGSHGRTGGYFPRKLTAADDTSQTEPLNEAGLVDLKGPRVVLGEPGMGKSELMRELGGRLGVEPVSATRFMNAKNPTKLVPVGKPLLIDALDEAMARREGDAIDPILAQLEEAGSPPFILSCRSREWQARSATNLRQLYGSDPHILVLEPFSRGEACLFLQTRHPLIDAEYVLGHLEEHNLEELYGNPLTLDLLGRVAESDRQLPATRATLFGRVCALIWPEHDPNRQDMGLAQLNEDEALDAAGAIATSLLLAGSEAASVAGAAQILQGDIRLSDIERLPHAAGARAVFSSKLFQSGGTLRAIPIHKVIAEFLGARWLARQALAPRAQRRLLTQFQGSGSVPASLRGLHAWLAYHSPTMADAVIAADPYGVLRYGEPTANQADRLFDALCALAEEDPYFRGADWDSRTAAGLMNPALKAKIKTIIASADSSAHLRSLLIEGLNGAVFTAELADTLEAVMLSSERFYREREDAAEALKPHRETAWWRAAITTLRDQGDQDSTRLAHRLLVEIGAEVSSEILVSTLFAEMDLTICPLPRREDQRVHTVRDYDQILDAIAPSRLVEVLDLITDYSDLLLDSNWQSANDVANIAAHLIVRTIDAGLIGVEQGADLWRWLGVIKRARRFGGEIKEALGERLRTHHDLRHAVQAYVLKDARRRDSLWATEIDLQERLIGISQQAEDLIWAFDKLAEGDNRDAALRKDWCDLVRLAGAEKGADPTVHVAAERFRRGDRQLGAFLCKLRKSKTAARDIRKESRAEKQRRKRAALRSTADGIRQRGKRYVPVSLSLPSSRKLISVVSAICGRMNQSNACRNGSGLNLETMRFLASRPSCIGVTSHPRLISQRALPRTESTISASQLWPVYSSECGRARRSQTCRAKSKLRHCCFAMMTMDGRSRINFRRSVKCSNRR